MGSQPGVEYASPNYMEFHLAPPPPPAAITTIISEDSNLVVIISSDDEDEDWISLSSCSSV